MFIFEYLHNYILTIKDNSLHLFVNLKINEQKIIFHSNYKIKICFLYFFKNFKYLINVFLYLLRK